MGSPTFPGAAMRTNDVFKRAYNQCLSQLAEVAIDSNLGTENNLARTLGVSDHRAPGC